jgi:hypothetical protein
MENKTIKTSSELRARIRERAQQISEAKAKKAAAQGDNVSDVQDPTLAGNPSTPKDPEMSAAKTNLPGAHTNKDNGTAANTMENNSAGVDTAAPKPAAVEPAVKGAALIAKVKKAAAAVAEQTASDATKVENKLPGAGKKAPKVEGDNTETPGDVTNMDKSSSKETVEFNKDFNTRLASMAKLAAIGQAVVECEDNFEKVSNMLQKHKGIKAANALLADAKKAAHELQVAKAQDQAIEAYIKSASAEQLEGLQKLAAIAEISATCSPEQIEAIANAVEQKVAQNNEAFAKLAAIAEISAKCSVEEIEKIASAVEAKNAQEQAGLQKLAAVAEAVKDASPEQIHIMAKLASAHKQNMTKFASDAEKRAYAQGAEDVAAAMDVAAEQGSTEVPEVSIEDIIMLLDQLVQSGQLDAATAQALAEALLAEQAPAGDPAAEAPVETPAPTDEELAAEMAKASSIAKKLK